MKVRREEEGSSLNCPELAAFVLSSLHDNPVTKPMLYLCYNQALMKAMKSWIDKGRKATSIGAPDANMFETVEELRQKTIGQQQEHQKF